jgi:hypothetical protein
MSGDTAPHAEGTGVERAPPPSAESVPAPAIIAITLLSVILPLWLAAAVAAWWIPEQVPWLVPQQKSARGSIILSSPTIYTRQRLVNDRLSQADWLKDQLKETERGPASNFRSIDALAVTSARSNFSANIGISHGASSNSGEKDQTKENANSAGETRKYEIEQTTLDRFLAMNMYRDTVRSDLMQTLLDDRHDIAGNTIYRLGFDATVVGGRDTDQLAIIYVTLQHEAFSCHKTTRDVNTEANIPDEGDVDCDVGTVKPLSDSESGERDTERILTNTDYQSVYNDWVNNLRTYLVTVRDVNLVSLSQGREPPQFDRFLNEQICTTIRNRLEIRWINESTGDDDDLSDTLCIRSIDKWSVNLAEADHTYDLKNRWRAIEQAIRDFEQSVKFSSPNPASPPPRTDISKEFPKYLQICKDEPFQPFHLSVESSTVNGGSGVPCPVDTSILARDEKIRLFVMLKYFDKYLDSPSAQASLISELAMRISVQDTKEAFLETIDNYFNSKSLSLSEENGKEIMRSFGFLANEEEQILARKRSAQDLQDDILRMESDKKKDDLTTQRRLCAVEEYLRWEYNDGLGKSRFISKPLLRTNEATSRLDHYVYLQSDWGDISNCTLIVLPLTGTHPQGWERLRLQLDQNDEMFVYSVEPKNYGQRVSTATQVSRTLALGVAGEAGLGDEKAQATAALLAQQGRQMDEIENHALVLPLGEGVASLSPQGPHQVSFGWAIAPRMLPDSNKPIQVDGTYALSAVISVPSWWRTLKANYHMCWIDPGRVDIQRAPTEGWDYEEIKRVCQDSGKKGAPPIKDTDGTVQAVNSSYVSPGKDFASNLVEEETPKSDFIRLPHTVPEIYRKLGFEFLEVPHLSTQQLPPLFAGFPGDLRLEGERLWRGTDVFLNSQRADRIMVLPDMKGIVAHFNCVLLPKEDPNHLRSAAVTVVTSEGSDRLAAPVEVDSPPDDRITQVIAGPETQNAGTGPQGAQVPGKPAKGTDMRANEHPTRDQMTMSETAILKRCASVAERGWIETLDDEKLKTGFEELPAKPPNERTKITDGITPSK